MLAIETILCMYSISKDRARKYSINGEITSSTGVPFIIGTFASR